MTNLSWTSKFYQYIHTQIHDAHTASIRIFGRKKSSHSRIEWESFRSRMNGWSFSTGYPLLEVPCTTTYNVESFNMVVVSFVMDRCGKISRHRKMAVLHEHTIDYRTDTKRKLVTLKLLIGFKCIFIDYRVHAILDLISTRITREILWNGKLYLFIVTSCTQCGVGLQSYCIDTNKAIGIGGVVIKGITATINIHRGQVRIVQSLGGCTTTYNDITLV